jgi:hypothetical protein
MLGMSRQRVCGSEEMHRIFGAERCPGGASSLSFLFRGIIAEFRRRFYLLRCSNLARDL